MPERLAVALPGEAWTSVTWFAYGYGECYKCSRVISLHTNEQACRVYLHTGDDVLHIAHLCADCYETATIEQVLEMGVDSQENHAMHHEVLMHEEEALAQDHWKRAANIRALAPRFAAEGVPTPEVLAGGE